MQNIHMLKTADVLLTTKANSPLMNFKRRLQTKQFLENQGYKVQKLPRKLC